MWYKNISVGQSNSTSRALALHVANWGWITSTMYDLQAPQNQAFSEISLQLEETKKNPRSLQI